MKDTVEKVIGKLVDLPSTFVTLEDAIETQEKVAQEIIDLVLSSQRQQVGWYHPQSKRFCYLDQKDPTKNVFGAEQHYKGYSVPVFIPPQETE